MAVGDKIKVKNEQLRGFCTSDDYKRYRFLEICDMQGDKVITKNKTGSIETFTKREVVMMFRNNKMSKTEEW